MQKHIERPVHRNKPQRVDDERHDIWPLSAREFMKLPASVLVSAGTRLTFLVKREASNVKRAEGEIRAYG